MVKFLIFILGLLVVAVIGGYCFLNSEKFGALPSGERLARIQQSANYRNGVFQNSQKTELFTGEGNRLFAILNELLHRNPEVVPKSVIPVVKTDLHHLPADKNLYIWFGHSGYLLQLDGKKYLIDPTLIAASPVSFFGKPFTGADYFKPEHIPAVDVLIISHDHWDHLDYDTVQAIEKRVGKVVTALGVGAHFERWGWHPEKVLELDWQQNAQLFDGVHITALPARHFSGRGFTRDKSLWASFMLQTPSKTVYIGGDSGYGEFYADIAKQFPKIDLAILENGQYSKNWANTHDLPNKLPQVIETLHPQKLVTVHNSKYTLSNHSWREPMDQIAAHAAANNLPLYTPKIGEVFDLDSDLPEKFQYWWAKLQ